MNLEQKVSVLPRSFSQMGAPMQEYFSKLDAYEAPFLKERLAMDGHDTHNFEEAFGEFKKFVAIGKLTRKPIAMTSDAIDAVWHQFILFTRDYKDFCEEFYGGFLHHNPNVPSRPGRMEAARQEIDNLVRSYSALYGPMPAIWNISQVKP